jgi:hypothetical protein
LLTFVVLASPAPHVLTVARLLAANENTGSDTPHDETEDEDPESKEGVIDGGLFRTFVASVEVSPEDHDAERQRDAGDGQKSHLWPDLGFWCPGRKRIPRWNRLGCIEDGKCAGNHGQDDKTAAEIDPAKEHLCHSDSGLDFLGARLVTLPKIDWNVTYQIFGVVIC